MKEFIAGLVTVSVAFIGAGIVYQIVKPGSQGPTVVKDITDTTGSLGGALFK